MSICNQLDLGTLGSQLSVYENLPRHCYKRMDASCNVDIPYLVTLPIKIPKLEW